MGEYEFIQENPRWAKIWIFVSSALILTILLLMGILFSTVFYDFFYSLPFVSGGVGFLVTNIKNVTLFGLFLAHLIGGIFFVPSPDEIIFYYGLLKGNNFILAIVFSTTGYMLAQFINYYAGSKISNPIMNIVSKKKIYNARRFVNKHGAIGIFLFNFLPFPAPLLTFALGIAKYNFTRLFTLTLIGKLAKYIVVIIIYFVISG